MESELTHTGIVNNGCERSWKWFSKYVEPVGKIDYFAEENVMPPMV
jgi:hypothetical protein